MLDTAGGCCIISYLTYLATIAKYFFYNLEFGKMRGCARPCTLVKWLSLAWHGVPARPPPCSCYASIASQHSSQLPVGRSVLLLFLFHSELGANFVTITAPSHPLFRSPPRMRIRPARPSVVRSESVCRDSFRSFETLANQINGSRLQVVKLVRLFRYKNTKIIDRTQ